MAGENFPLKPFYFDLIPKEKLKVHFHLNDQEKQKKVEEVMKPLVLDEATYDKVYQAYDEQMTLSLMKNPPKKSCLFMLNSFIPEFTNGKEEGEYLAIDLGGTNFRVNWIKLDAGKIVATKSKHYVLTQQIQQGSGTQLFDFLADCIKDSLEEFNLSKKDIPLGFTFSFPTTQKALNVAHLITWCINFNCPEVVGKDVVRMLNTALRKKLDTKVEVAAIMNDMTAVLVHGVHLDPRTVIGVGIGTGTNACYIEKVSNINCWNKEDIPADQTEIIIDTEFCAFGDNGCLDFIQTEYDVIVNKESLNANTFAFEKYTSGDCLGELVRLVFVKLIQNGVLFTGKNVQLFNQKHAFKTRMISECEKDIDPDCNENTKNVLKELGLLDLASSDDINIIRYVCSMVSIRGSRFLAICIANLIHRIGRPDVTVAIDGSVYKKHPKYHSIITHAIADLLPNQKFRLMLAEDGSSIGAGLVAAISNRLKNKKA